MSIFNESCGCFFSRLSRFYPAFSLTSPPRVPTIRRLPKASRRLAVERFSALLEGVVRDNTPSSWVSLLLFTSNCLYSPQRGGRRWSLATAINKQLEDCSGPPQGLLQPLRSFSGPLPPEYLRNAVSSRLEEGDFGGAIRLASASDSLAPHSAATFRALQEKHPSPSSPPLLLPPLSQLLTPVFLSPNQRLLKPFCLPSGFFRWSRQPQTTASEGHAFH